MASQPDDLRERSNQLEQTGQELIALSFELESRLHQVQQRYASGTASVPAVEPWEGEVPEEEASPEVRSSYCRTNRRRTPRPQVGRVV